MDSLLSCKRKEGKGQLREGVTGSTRMRRCRYDNIRNSRDGNHRPVSVCDRGDVIHHASGHAYDRECPARPHNDMKGADNAPDGGS